MNTAAAPEPSAPRADVPVAAAHLYLYYRLRPDADAAAARMRVRAMQAALAQRTGIHGRLMRRADDAATWMEVYENVADPEAFGRALEAAVCAHRLADLLAADGTRHVECFVEKT